MRAMTTTRRHSCDLATPIAKYWTCKRQPGFVYEALECHGGAGFIEEGVMARYFRSSPLNAIWEGSGNVIALDVLRAIGREPDSLEAVVADIMKAQGVERRITTAAKRSRPNGSNPARSMN